MVCIVYSRVEPISQRLGELVVEALKAVPAGEVGGRKRFAAGHIEIIETDRWLVQEEGLDRIIDADLFVFLSRHKSKKAVPSFTVHPLGNWGDNAEIGGMPKALSVSAPFQMQDILSRLNIGNKTDFNVIYEATHHGPLLDTPSFFVEVGGPETIDSVHYETVSKAVCDHVLGKPARNGRVAIGVGGTHYPERFTKLALEGRYSFSHMMPKHSCTNIDMLGVALERSSPRAECAVVDWKGVGPAEQRNLMLSALERLNIEIVKI